MKKNKRILYYLIYLLIAIIAIVIAIKYNVRDSLVNNHYYSVQSYSARDYFVCGKSADDIIAYISDNYNPYTSDINIFLMPNGTIVKVLSSEIYQNYKIVQLKLYQNNDIVWALEDEIMYSIDLNYRKD